MNIRGYCHWSKRQSKAQAQATWEHEVVETQGRQYNITCWGDKCEWGHEKQFALALKPMPLHQLPLQKYETI